MNISKVGNAVEITSSKGETLTLSMDEMGQLVANAGNLLRQLASTEMDKGRAPGVPTLDMVDFAAVLDVHRSAVVLVPSPGDGSGWLLSPQIAARLRDRLAELLLKAGQTQRFSH